MARLISHDGPTVSLADESLTRTRLQALVGQAFRFIDLTSGDVLVVSLDLQLPINKTATVFAGKQATVHGDAVLCTPEEIA